ncbi:MAG: hypothetical protein IT353_20730 [Gemmatimonadaceae bacterium]|nr:hypothetical protein [Gemmatimonadaceae bacterium]
MARLLHHRSCARVLTAALALALSAAALPQAHAQGAPPPMPAESRQFDFWLGSWEVFAPDGKKVGENRVERIANGWGLAEHWTATAGGTGRSLNGWSLQRQRWQQFWIGIGGTIELEGGLNARGEMVMSSQPLRRGNTVQISRITWTPNADGSVRQFWETSADSGRTWTPSFDGLYKKRSN